MSKHGGNADPYGESQWVKVRLKIERRQNWARLAQGTGGKRSLLLLFAYARDSI